MTKLSVDVLKISMTSKMIVYEWKGDELEMEEIILHFYMNCLADWKKSRFAAFLFYVLS